MQGKIKYYQQQIVNLRKRMGVLERKRAQFPQETPPEIWQEFMSLSREIGLVETELEKINLELVEEINQTRDEIILALTQYNNWREQMRQIENTFLANIVHPGQQLKLCLRQKQYLDQEYQRMRIAIQNANYFGLQELETDIRKVLMQADAILEAQENDTDEQLNQDEELFDRFDDISVDDILDAFSMEGLVSAFKRVVLPEIHPDTSDASSEVFKTVFEAYERGDALLMEAYIIKYQGVIKPQQDMDPLENLDKTFKTYNHFLQISVNLQQRIDHLKQELTSQAVDQPEKLKADMLQRRQEILDRIRIEAEEILHRREMIERLIQVYHDTQADVR